MLTILSAIPVVGKLIVWILGLFGVKQPAEVQEGEKVGAQGVQVESLESQNAQLENAAAASGAADVQRVRGDPASEHVTLDPTASVNNLPGEAFRD